MAARTVLEVVVAADPRSLEAGMRRSGAAVDKFGKETEKTSKKAGANLVGIGSAAKLAGGTILASGLVSQIKAIAQATADSEVSTARMSAQLKASNISYEAHAKAIDKVIQKTSQLAGLDDEDLQDAFTGIVRATGKVNESLKLVGVAADIARAKHMDVAKAGELVGKVANGNIGVLKRYGVAFDPITKAQDALKNSGEKVTAQQKEQAKATDLQATKQAALAALQDKFAGQAEKYGKTSQGSYDRLGVAVENLQEQLGTYLAPALASAADAIAGFLVDLQDGSTQAGKFANGVKDAVETIAPLFRAAFKSTRAQLEGFIGALKGVVRVIKGIIHGDLGEVFAGLKDIVASAFKQISAQLRTAASLVAKPASAVGRAIVNGVTGVVRNLPGNIFSLMGKVGDKFADIASAVGSRAGKIGKAIVAGIVNAIKSAPGAIVNAVGSIIPGPLKSALKTAGGAAGAIGDLFGRRGGRMTSGGFRRYQDGGMVPAFVSSGEMIVHGGQTSMVPGPRVAADNVFTYLPEGAAVITGHGQELMRGGASVMEAVQQQAPHFAGGGIVGAARAARKAGLSSSSLVTAVAIAGPESGYDPRNRLVTSQEDSRGLWQINTYAHKQYANANLYDPDVNARAMFQVSGGGRNWGPWTGYTSGRYRDYMERARQAVLGTRGGAGADTGSSGGGSSSGTRTLVSHKTVLGDRYKGSARLAGFEEGLDGRSRISGGLLGELASGALGRRVRVEKEISTGSSRSSGSSSSSSTPGTNQHGTALMDGKPVAKWIIPILQWAKGHGWGGQVSSGYRTPSEQIAAATRYGLSHYPNGPLASNHVRKDYPGGAVDVTAYGQLAGVLRGYSRKPNLVWGGPVMGDQVHFSANGHRRGGIIRRFGGGGMVTKAGTSSSLGPSGGQTLKELIAAAVGAKATDTSGTLSALSAVASRLASTERVGFDVLGRTIARATAGAASARKDGDRLEARRLDAVANIARAQQGIRLGAPISRAQATITGVDLLEHRAQTSQLARGVDSNSLGGMDENIALAKSSITSLTGKRQGLLNALKRAEKIGNKTAIDKLSEELTSFDDGIADRAASLKALQRDRAQTQAEAWRTAKFKPFEDNEAAANAGYLRSQVDSPDDLSDDLRDLNNALTAATAGYDAAVAGNDPEKIAQFGQDVLALRGSVKQVADAIAAAAEDARYKPFEDASAGSSLALLRAQVDSPGDLSDDLAALTGALGTATAGYQQAIAEGNTARITEFGQSILSLRGSIESLNGSIQQNTSVLTDMLKAQLEAAQRAAAIAQNETTQIGRALASLVAGELGGRVGLGLMTPSYAGGGARY